ITLPHSPSWSGWTAISLFVIIDKFSSKGVGVAAHIHTVQYSTVSAVRLSDCSSSCRYIFPCTFWAVLSDGDQLSIHSLFIPAHYIHVHNVLQVIGRRMSRIILGGSSFCLFTAHLGVV
ncbi:unnamed protein product, partial [Sphacelaria rigidula]